MRRISILSLVLALCLSPGGAGAQFCTVTEDSDATSKMQRHPPTARVIEEFTTDRSIPIQQAARRLEEVVDREGLDKVVGHLRLVASDREPRTKVTAYEFLFRIGAGRRADVARLFLEGLEDPEPRVRTISAWGLKMAPSAEREKAGFALFDRLATEADNDVKQALLESLVQVTTHAHSERAGELHGLLSGVTPDGVVPELFAAWKYKAARVMINTFGPEGAIELFQKLDAFRPGERLGIEAAVSALGNYGMENFGEMDDLKRRDALRELFRTYGISLISQDTKVEAERDSRIRLAVLKLLFPAVLGSSEHWRPEDIVPIRSALLTAASKEREGSELSELIELTLGLLP